MSVEINFRLRKAFISRNIEEIKDCLSRGACANQKFVISTNVTLLHQSPDVEVTRLLLLHGADVQATDNYEQTPLHSATYYRKGLPVVRELLFNGADVNAKDFAGMSALHYAITYRNELGVICELLRHGADVQAKNKEGDTALHLAVGCGGYDTNLDIIKELLEFGADVTTKNKFSSSLDVTLKKRDINCAKELIKITLFNNFDSDWEKVNDLIHHINSFNILALSSYMNECISEMTEVKEHLITGNLPLITFIKKRGKVVKTLYSDNKDIEQEISSKYIHYSDMILPIIRACLERGSLLNELIGVHVSIRLDTGKDVILNCDCLYKIAKYLSNDDLLNFIRAFQHF